MDDEGRLESLAELESLLKAERDSRRYNKLSEIYPDVGKFSRDKYPKHMELFEAGAKYQQRAIIAGNGVGKALRNGTPVATPRGWVPIESLNIGDVVIAGDGTQTRVVGVYPQGMVNLLRFTFDGGQSIDCCENHLWKMKTPASRWGGGDWTIEKARDIKVGLNPKRRPIVPHGCTWQIPARNVPIAPYLLGALIGDGGLTKGVVFTTADVEMVGHVMASLPSGVAMRRRGSYSYAISSNGGLSAGMRSNPLITELRALGLFGKKSHEKRIPSIYLLNDACVRLEVLRGLMDTDGSVGKGNLNTDITTTSPGLSDDIRFLVESLGGRAKIKRRTTRYRLHGELLYGMESYRVSIRIPVCPFRLSRKASIWMQRKPMKSERVLHRIEHAGRGKATCISVDHPDRTFITEHGIVTHNSWGVGAYETTLHATGLYPTWWKGKRVKRPARIWAAGKTRETMRDIVQGKLIGDIAQEGAVSMGTGMIPRSLIIDTPKVIPNTNGACDFVRVRHITGGESIIGFKSYEQGRKAFEGTERDHIWLDEEPPMDIYIECVMRGRTVDGGVLLTFTPLDGYSDVVSEFMDWESRNSQGDSKFMVQCGWSDVPHLSDEWKKQARAATPPHLRKAREEGVPTAVGSMVYPIAEEDFVVKPFAIPAHFRRCFGLDPGWHNTAAVWIAYDKDEDVAYLYADYKRGELPVEVHAAAFRARGAWIPGAGDVSDRDVGSGEKLIDQYKAQGVKVRLAEKGHDAGLQEVYSRLSTGRLKVFSTCSKWLDEYRQYRYDENNKVVKKNDHLMDATRFGLVSALKIASTEKLEQFVIDDVRFG